MQIAPHSLERLRDLLQRHSGLLLPDWVVAARASERARALELGCADDYVERLVRGGDGDELKLLVEKLRVGETSFFRHAAQLRALEKICVPQFRHLSKVRVWSAGCASGEEPYSLAMLLRRALPASVQLSVLASDMSADAIEAGARRLYPAAAADKIPPPYRRYIERPDGHAGPVRIGRELADLVTFEERNLALPGYPGGFDLILCRNVLIYFSADARDRAIDRLIASLKVDGYLVVGYSETLRSFERLHPERCDDGVIYRRTRTPANPTEPPDDDPSVPSPAPPPAMPVRPETCTVTLEGSYTDDDERLAAELAHPLTGRYRCVVIQLDGADYLGERAGQILRRALSAAAAGSISVRIEARRSGTRRWLHRAGISVEREP